MQLSDAVGAHLAALSANNYSNSTIASRALLLRGFVRWCGERGIARWDEVSIDAVNEYRCWIAASTAALSIPAQRNRLSALRALGAWLHERRQVASNPTAALVLPRLSHRLPQAVLSVREAERVLTRPRLGTVLGERDRAIIELLYSSGLRRAELLGLDLKDLDLDRHVVFVRRGKGGRQRLVPLGRRAVYWLRRYVSGSRSAMCRGQDHGALFIGLRGTRLTRARINERLRRYLDEANVAKRGSCHVWRHTMATVMHDRGADIRDLQLLLGHAQLSTTQIYTHVSAERLLRVHRRTHPGWDLLADEASW